ADAIRHRGPDAEQCWADAEAGVAFGFRRLSIIDLTPTGHQPMRSADGRYVVMTNGEIYNYRALRERLEQEGETAWRGTSDTEVLVTAIARWGIEPALEAANGMFALAVWDRKTRTLTLARDRMGEKPMYYGWSNASGNESVFLFGSELKALAVHPAWDRPINRGAVDLLLRHDYVPGPHTIFDGIFKLPPGHVVTVSAASASPGILAEAEPYWSASEKALAGAEAPFTGTEDDAAGQLEALLRDAIAIRLVADVPVGAFLSGGIDSATVVGIAQAASDQPVSSFTIGFEDPRFDEAPQAAAVAAHLGTNHTELYASEADALACVTDLPAAYDEPFADVSQIPTLLLSRLTRQHVTVGLTGDGGDELFAGYARYGRLAREWERASALPHALKSAAGASARALPVSAIDGALGWTTAIAGPKRRRGRPGAKLRRRLERAACDDPMMLYRGYVRRWHGVSGLVPGAPTLDTVFERELGLYRLAAPIDQAMVLDALAYLPDDLLVKVDRASMSASLEVRAPLLDHRVVEFAWSLPNAMKLRDGVTKRVLRRVLSRYVPDHLTDRPKAGFDPPLADWLRGDLRDWAEALIDPVRLKREGWIAPGPVTQRWREHVSGGRNWRQDLWNVLTFQAWLDWWQDQSQGRTPEPA
ncbi:MAG: asparagine synthase (glutamine-hydrolyzing), partial [Alphaproteobacteria bacterium]|nr:asparagine synthase (glutamine-hydrolyzing) [Alphaproteobacteria bacterium]